MKQKSLSLPRKLTESVIPPLFNVPEVFLSASDKAKFLAKCFSRNPNLDDSSNFLPLFLSRTNLRLHNISVTPKIINTFALPMISGPNFIPAVFLGNCEPELS